eukprot:21573-Pyramimonas_sp.AAC.1
MKYGLIRRVGFSVKPEIKCATWILGDFNCLDPGGSRLFLRAEPASCKTDTAGGFFANTFPYLCELVQLNPTFRVQQNEKLVSAGRLDRVYVSLDSGHLLELKPAAGVVWPVADLSRPSDCAPVYAQLNPGQRPSAPRIPSWVIKKPQFSTLVQDLWKDMPVYGGAFLRLRGLKEALHEAARQAKEGLSVDGPATSQEMLSRYFAVLRAMTQANRRVVLKAVRAFPEFNDFIDAQGELWVDYAGFMNRMRSLSEQVLEEEAQELFATPQLSDEYKSKKAQQL